jgi:hypothetical protein
MAIVADKFCAWENRNQSAGIPIDAVQVGVSRDKYYALTPAGKIIAFGYTAKRRTKPCLHLFRRQK